MNKQVIEGKYASSINSSYVFDISFSDNRSHEKTNGSHLQSNNNISICTW